MASTGAEITIRDRDPRSPSLASDHANGDSDTIDLHGSRLAFSVPRD
jgi:hypothetical protein